MEIKKSRDLHEKSRDLSNYEIFQHKILKSQIFKKRAVYWYFYATLNIFSQLKLLPTETEGMAVATEVWEEADGVAVEAAAAEAAGERTDHA